MHVVQLGFDFIMAPWQWGVVGIAGLVLVVGVVLRQIQRKKAGLNG